MAVRGTTPDYELIIEGYDLTGATVHVTFSEGRLKIDKTGDDLTITTATETRGGVEITISTITLSLTQRETLYLHEGTASIQVKWIDSDGKVLATETDTPIPDTEATPDNLDTSSQFLLARGLVEMPEQTQPDYFNESEPEPNYFEED